MAGSWKCHALITCTVVFSCICTAASLDCYECKWAQAEGGVITGDAGCEDDFALDDNVYYIKRGCTSCMKIKTLIDLEQVEITRSCHTLTYQGNYCNEERRDFDTSIWTCYCSLDNNCNSAPSLQGGALVWMVTAALSGLLMMLLA
ncbi:PREDICTED: uncharacterized protein LOC106813579 isoform X2 [Priapulus caudatus]|uniref:Uncharacterized protein LOC106813579 isoform X1 n=1 Tax=Priapulus caudatus TaxID=37621 RepID=A0ABM1EM18_PRICU|nr:PREDICTED: uncharacterized protein LOC106813579 isoform X1 [Priapulus caudatus]XP_014673240.1 PREDICTED: uncharacterized protein LOC106813579 isoform X2 [Priapulus caudatus]